ncbi:MAG: ERCC4 domain-containing protein [Methylophilus sp.]|uniref:ERCC4 domain-containing protein n=1 Tax=Methylophilus sp. TaxID=29541 RepID=UPI003FA1279A
MAEEIKKVTIHADYREARSKINSLLEQMPGVTLVSADLNTGDYVIGNGVGIERKEATDFVNSIMSNHLFGQLALMKEEFSKSYLLIEGDPFSTRSAINDDALIGFISYITELTEVKIVPSKNVFQSAKLIHRLAIHAEHGLGYIPPLRSAKPKEFGASVAFVCQGLPGVGPQTAINLIKHFGSLSALFTATVEQLRSVDGVGPKMADKIWSVINHTHL